MHGCLEITTCVVLLMNWMILLLLLHNPDFLCLCILDSETRKELGQKIKEHIKETLVPARKGFY